MPSLADSLRDLPDSTWSPEDPGSREALETLEHAYQLRLPEDYRDLMLHSNGGTLTGRGTTLNFEPLEILKGHNRDERFVDHLPGMFVIGDDGGGSVYYYDPKNHLGRGEWAVFLVSLGTIGFPYSIYAGASLTDVIDAILSGEDLYKRPRLRETSR